MEGCYRRGPTRLLILEAKDVERRIGRLVSAIETGADAASLVEKLRELEARKRSIVEQCAALQPVPRLDAEVIESRLAEWRRLLRQSTTQGRSVLQRVLRGRITFTPRADGLGYDFSCRTRFEKPFTGIIAKPPRFVTTGDTRGIEHVASVDTLDFDYGRLLDRVAKYGEVLASPAGVEPAF